MRKSAHIQTSKRPQSFHDLWSSAAAFILDFIQSWEFESTKFVYQVGFKTCPSLSIHISCHIHLHILQFTTSERDNWTKIKQPLLHASESLHLQKSYFDSSREPSSKLHPNTIQPPVLEKEKIESQPNFKVSSDAPTGQLGSPRCTKWFVPSCTILRHATKSALGCLLLIRRTKWFVPSCTILRHATKPALGFLLLIRRNTS